MSISKESVELYEQLTPEEQDEADAAKCPEHPLDVWVQSWGEDQNAWCEAGLSGAHLTHWLVAGCQMHGRGHKLHPTGRFCPGDCTWSRQGAMEETGI
jgi:hypothetical protein